MLKIIGKLCICLLLVALQLSAGGFAENSSELARDAIQVIVSTGELSIEQEVILVNINGLWYPVQSLEKRGPQWMAKIEVDHNNLNYCPRLHPLCRHCKQCHNVGCWYYVKRCPGRD